MAGLQSNEKDIFTNHYASLCNTLTDVNNLLPYFVQENVITTNDVEEINASKIKSERVEKLLSHISGPLESGDTKGLHTMLTIMKEYGNQSTKDLAVKMSCKVASAINKTESEATDYNNDQQHSKQEPNKRSSNAFAIQFSMLLANIGCLLDGKCSDKLEKCKQFCCTLQVSDESSELLLDDKQLKEINQCLNFRQLFTSHLRFHLNWEQYLILESIIALTELKEAEDEFDKYKKHMASKMGMKIISDTFSIDDLPENSIELSIIVDRPYTKLTAGEYIELKSFICDILKIRKYVTYPYIKFLIGSLHLEWYIPVQAARYMIKTAASLNISLCLQQSVVFLKIGDEVIFDRTVKKGNPSNCKSSGYDCHFENTPPDRLVCKICYLPCREAQQNECCGSVYCKGDIDQYKANTTLQLACPMCRAKDFVTYPNLATDREIQQLMVYCPDKDSGGCDWVGKLKVVDKHYSYGRECETECEKCNTIVKHKLLRSHLDTECPCYCPYCDITAEREVISSEHKEKCYKFPLTCPNNCGLDKIPRDNMNEHKKVCPLEMIQCEFNDVGCEAKFPRKDEESHVKDYVTVHLHLTQLRLSIVNRKLEESNVKYINTTETLTKSLSDLQEKVKALENLIDNDQPVNKDILFKLLQSRSCVDTETQTDTSVSGLRKEATTTRQKICALSINLFIWATVTAVIGILLLYINPLRLYYIDSPDLPSVSGYHENVSVVLYELINASTLPWPTKLHHWSSITTIAPVVLKISNFSKKKNSVLYSEPFFAFQNGFELHLKYFPYGFHEEGIEGRYMSVYLHLAKGPYDEILEKGGYFPMKIDVIIELLNPREDNDHICLTFQSDGYHNCNDSWNRRVTKVPINPEGCGFHKLISLEGYNFESNHQCAKGRRTICDYLTSDDALYFRVHIQANI